MTNWYKIAQEQPKPDDTTPPIPKNQISVADIKNPDVDPKIIVEVLQRNTMDGLSLLAFSHPKAPLEAKIKWLVATNNDNVLFETLKDPAIMAEYIKYPEILEALLVFVYQACISNKREIYNAPEAVEIVHAALGNQDTLMRAISMSGEFTTKMRLKYEDERLIKEVVDEYSPEKIQGAKGFEQWKNVGGFKEFEGMFAANTSWYKRSEKE